MTGIFNRFTELDPALEAAQIEAKVGSPVFDKYSFLDEARFNAQAAAALGGTLDLPALLDPARARDEFEAMAAVDTGGGGGGYVAKAVQLDGATTLVTADALGVIDSPVVLTSHWFNPAQVADRFARIQTAPDGNFFVEKASRFSTSAGGSDSANFATNWSAYASTEGVNAAGMWYHLLCKQNVNFDVGSRILQVYLNDVPVDMGSDLGAGVAFAFNLSEGTWNLDEGDGIATAYADVYCAPGQDLDLSITANRRKFISDTLKPVDLGADGSTPTGIKPLFFLTGDKDHFLLNATGNGAFATVGGTLTNATTSPSD